MPIFGNFTTWIPKSTGEGGRPLTPSPPPKSARELRCIFLVILQREFLNPRGRDRPTWTPLNQRIHISPVALYRVFLNFCLVLPYTIVMSLESLKAMYKQCPLTNHLKNYTSCVLKYYGCFCLLVGGSGSKPIKFLLSLLF